MTTIYYNMTCIHTILYYCYYELLLQFYIVNFGIAAAEPCTRLDGRGQLRILEISWYYVILLYNVIVDQIFEYMHTSYNHIVSYIVVCYSVIYVTTNHLISGMAWAWAGSTTTCREITTTSTAAESIMAGTFCSCSLFFLMLPLVAVTLARPRLQSYDIYCSRDQSAKEFVVEALIVVPDARS